MITQIFLFQCPYCHKQRELVSKRGFIGSKEIETIECVCGKQVNVFILKFSMTANHRNIGTENYIVN